MESQYRQFIILIILFFSAFAGKAQEKDYSIIHFVYTKVLMDKANPRFYEEFVDQASYVVYVNDRSVATVSGYEELKIKVYSEGPLTITIVYNGNPLYLVGVDYKRPLSVGLNVENGKDYYVARCISLRSRDNVYFKAVDSTTWNSFAPIKRTLDIEEDINKPWGKFDNSKKSGQGQGTCFAISPNGYLVTNYHCIENAKEITVKGIDGDLTTKYGATVVASDPSNDLAILKIGNKNVKFNVPSYGFRSSGVAQAEKVYALGFPAAAAMGTEVKITEGIISAKSGVNGDISKFQISAAVNPGNSGGPLIDEQGNLIGVIFAKSTIAESAGYAIKASYLETFLKNVEGFEFPTFVNSMKDKPFTEKVADWKNYIFIVETN